MKKIFKQVIIWVLVVVIVVTGYFIFVVAKNLSFINQGTGEQIPLNLSKNTNILILGTDQRTEDEPSRSDTIILVNIDPKTKEINLISIPRDARVDIPGHGYDKINSAFNSAYFEDGGVELSTKTVENLLGLKEESIPYYVVVNFQGFEKVIDALGGVTINVRERMVYYSRAGDVKIDLKPGIQHLNGEQALEYARFRYDAYGDFTLDEEGNVHGRIERQQELIKAVIDQTKDIRTLWKFPAIAKAVGEAVNTNLTPSQITKLALLLKDLSSQDIKTINCPGKPEYIDSISYIIPDYEKLKEIGAQYFSIENKQ
jgi:LCP family protein required for cell wall assembly